MGKRRAGRELALRALFQIDVGGASPQEAIDSWLKQSDDERGMAIFARELVEGVIRELIHIDKAIAKYAREWTLDRMANVDRNVLRLAVFELLYEPDVPSSVAVDEAVELAKKYSTAESGKFVNGILGNLVRNLDQELVVVKQGAGSGHHGAVQ